MCRYKKKKEHLCIFLKFNLLKKDFDNTQYTTN